MVCILPIRTRLPARHNMINSSYQFFLVTTQEHAPQNDYRKPQSQTLIFEKVLNGSTKFVVARFFCFFAFSHKL